MEYEYVSKESFEDFEFRLLKIMNAHESGRCPLCGSEDIEEYYDGTAECHECGARWWWRCQY